MFQLGLGHFEEKVRLIFARIQGLKQLIATGCLVLTDSGIVSRGQFGGSNLRSSGKKVIELHEGITPNTRDRSFSLQIGPYEGDDHFLLESFLKIDHIKRQIQETSHPTGIEIGRASCRERV